MALLLHYRRMHAAYKSQLQSCLQGPSGEPLSSLVIVCAVLPEINQKADRDKFSFPSPKVHPGQFPKGLKLYPMLGRAYENRPHPMDMSPIRSKLEAFQILVD